MDVGVVAALWRYPVKSMLGEAFDAVRVEARGVVGDRRWAVRDGAGKPGSGKDTRRFRRIDGLFRFRARLDGEVPVVLFPDGRALAGDAPEIHAALSAELGLPVTLAREIDVSHFDAGPLHLVTTSSLEALGGVDARRFRPNLVLDTGGSGFVEDGWLGRELAVGDEVRVRIAKPTARCVMVGLAQAELSAAPGLPRAVAERNGSLLGVYAEVLAPGEVRVGDRVQLLEPPVD